VSGHYTHLVRLRGHLSLLLLLCGALLTAAGPANAGSAAAAAVPSALAGPHLGAQHTAITGRVLGLGGRPIVGACVTAAGPGYVRPVRTDSAGRFALTGLRPGGYRLSYSDCAAPGRYAAQWSGGAFLPAQGRLVQVIAGKELALPSVTLRAIDPARLARQDGIAPAAASLSAAGRPGQISGVVRNRAGKPLAGICVLLTRRVVTSEAGGSGTVSEETEQTWTDGHGSYGSGPLGRGRWQVMFSAGCGNSGNYAPQWWRRSATSAHAAWLFVGPHRGYSAVNAALGPGAAVAGTIVDAAGAGVGGTCVQAVGLGAMRGVFTLVTADSAGRYRITGLGTGKYLIQAGPELLGCGGSANLLDGSRMIAARARATTSEVNIRLRRGGVISGVVTSGGPGGLPLAGICVTAVPDSLALLGQTYGIGGTATAANGGYRIDQLYPGRYLLAYTGGCGAKRNWAPRFYPGVGYLGQAEHVPIGVGANRVIDAVMAPGAAITGQVRSAKGRPLPGICVSLVASGLAANPGSADVLSPAAQVLVAVGTTGYAVTNRHGNYAVANLAPGHYKAQFYSRQTPWDPCTNAGGYAWQWFSGQSAFGAAGQIWAPAGAVTPGADAAMRPGGTISGRVTDRSGRPIGHVCVILTGRQRLTDFSPLSGGQIPITTRHGTYRIAGLPAGRYWAWFDPASLCGAKLGHQLGWHRGWVTVRASRVTPDVDGRLGGAGDGSISGRVTSAQTGRAVRNACVAASTVFMTGATRRHPLPADGLPGPEAVTGRGGRFAFTQLPKGIYLLIVRPCASPLAPAEVRVRLGINQQRTHLTLALRRGATITGTVRATGGSAAGVCAEAIPERGALLPATGGVAVTGLAGSYAITGLAPGRYRVLFTPACSAGAAPAAPAWYGGPVPSVITVGPGGTRADVGGVLAADGGISGTVTGRDSGPLAGVCVTAVPTSGTTSLGSAVTSITTAGGGYTIGELVPGSYRVKFTSGCGASGWKTQWWQHENTSAQATIATVTPATVTNGVDAAMMR
jgi:protocatechuate 3,4-dioxygenase beta subunit